MAFQNDKSATIEHCGGNCHVWIELSPSTFVDEEEEEDGGMMINHLISDTPTKLLLSLQMGTESNRAGEVFLALDRNSELLAKGQSDNTTVVEYTVFVYYTEEFAKATTDVKVRP